MESIKAEQAAESRAKHEFALKLIEGAICISAISGAVYLIANGYEDGWGWLIFLAFAVCA